MTYDKTTFKKGDRLMLRVGPDEWRLVEVGSIVTSGMVVAYIDDDLGVSPIRFQDLDSGAVVVKRVH